MAEARTHPTSSFPSRRGDALTPVNKDERAEEAREQAAHEKRGRS